MPTPEELKTMASQIQADAFQKSTESVTTLSDPFVDTPMVLTLEQLRAYDFDPRLTRNPRYDEIKASIRERGLDAPPAVTRRPGEPMFMIRNGGNTRLAILRELWTETKDEQFFRIPCLFRPWPERGDIVALTGHLAESDLHGSLSFIERALGVEKSREMYEKELERPLSQTELARLLCADGYPIQQSHISRMRDAVQYLLPAIPSVLYGGLGRHQVERLAILRKAAERVWEQYSNGKKLEMAFPELFQDVLALFDSDPEHFSLQRLQDELIGQMASCLEADYDTLALDIDISGNRQQALSRDPQTGESSPAVAPFPSASKPPRKPSNIDVPGTTTLQTEPPEAPPKPELLSVKEPVTERLAAIKHLLTEESEVEPPPLPASPLKADSLYPIVDIWHIDPGLDIPHRLRIHISQFAREIAEEAGQLDALITTKRDLGFLCALDDSQLSTTSPLSLLQALISPTGSIALRELLLTSASSAYLSDDSVIKLFRLIRLARRLHHLESNTHG